MKEVINANTSLILSRLPPNPLLFFSLSLSTVPSMPVNVSIREVTNTSVRVLWHRPENPNGVIQGYRMYFMHQNFTDVRTVRDPQQKMDYHLTGLSKFPPFHFDRIST